MVNKDVHPPYILTIVLAILGWLLTTYVDRLQKMPLVTYSVYVAEKSQGVYWKDQKVCNEQIASETAHIYVFKLKNLSYSSVFSDLTLFAKSDSGDITSAKVYAHPPSMAGDSPATCVPKSATFKDITLLPGGAFDLTVGVSNLSTEPFLLLQATEQAILLQPYGYKAFLLEYEFYILGLLAFILLMITVCYLKQIIRNR